MGACAPATREEDRWVSLGVQGQAKEGGSVDWYKCRLIAKGYSQRPGIDYDETFSPVVTLTTMRALIAYATQRGMFMHLDKENIHGSTGGLRGTREGQAHLSTAEILVWIEGITSLLEPRAPRVPDLRGVHSEPGRSMPVPPYMNENGSLVVIAMYADLIIAADRDDDIGAVKNMLTHCFKMKDLGQLSFILGLGI